MAYSAGQSTKVEHYLSSSPVALRNVGALAKYLKHLVIMGIGNCRNRKLFLCPVLFEKLYSATFPVASNTVYFECIDLNVRKYESWLKEQFKVHKWSQLGDWHLGSSPVPYNLFKLKDLIVPCSTVGPPGENSMNKVSK